MGLRCSVLFDPASKGVLAVAQFPTFAFNSSKKFSTRIRSGPPLALFLLRRFFGTLLYIYFPVQLLHFAG